MPVRFSGAPGGDEK